MLQEIVGNVLLRLAPPHPASCLIEIPPGCDEQPDCVARLQALIVDRPELDRITAVATADMVKDDDAFVDLLIREWCDKDHGLELAWSSEKTRLSELEAPQRLGAFFGRCIVSTGQYRIMLVRRFDSIFRRLSRELLAAMRSLEQQSLLYAVNCSPLSYEELYKRRARQEFGFTSDYGQFHSRLTAKPFDRVEALSLWEREYKLSSAGVMRAFFETAYDLSGGLPSAFAVAAGQARAQEAVNGSVSSYRSALVDQLPAQFERLLRYDDEDAGRRLIEAVAKLHLGTATKGDRQLIAGHRWRHLLAKEEKGELQLLSEALGRKALEMLRSSTAHEVAEPETLYREKEYIACVTAIHQTDLWSGQILYHAANMMAEVFGDAPRNLYFEARVKWRRVWDSALEAQRLCRTDEDRIEFRRWETIALAHDSTLGPRESARVNSDPGSGDSSLQSLNDACIRLSVRMLAVLHDRNSVTAAYAAIPLIETVLREYVRLVLLMPLDGTAFQGIPADRIGIWWKEKSEFRTPPGNAPLSGASLGLLAAIASDDRKKPLFRDSAEVSRMLRLLDARNTFGHDVKTPKDDMGKIIVERATTLLDRLWADGGSKFTIRDIEAWVRPPLHFLG